MKTVLIYIFFLLIVQSMQSQFNSEDIYNATNIQRGSTKDILFCGRGLLWITTDVGVYNNNNGNIEKVKFLNEKSQVFNIQNEIKCWKNDVYTLNNSSEIYKYYIEKDGFEIVFKTLNISKFDILDQDVIIFLEDKKLIKRNLRTKKSEVISNQCNDFIFCNKKILYVEENNLVEYDFQRKQIVRPIDPDNKLILLSENTYYIHHSTFINIYDKDHHLVDDIVLEKGTFSKSLIVVNDGYLFTYLGGIYHYNKKTKVKNPLKINIHQDGFKNYIKNLLLDSNNNLWFNDSFGFLYMINNYQNYYQEIYEKDKYLHNSSNRFIIDKKLLLYDLPNFKAHNFDPITQSKYNLTNNIVYNGPRRLVVAHEKNLMYYHDKGITFYIKNGVVQNASFINNYLKQNNIKIYRMQIPNDTFYILTQCNQLIIYDYRTNEIKKTQIAKDYEYKPTAFKYIDDFLYFLTNKQIIRCDLKHKNADVLCSFNAFQKNISYASNDFYVMNNQVFFVTIDKGLFRIDLEKNTTENVLQTESELYSIHKDKRNNFWLNAFNKIYIYNDSNQSKKILPFNNHNVRKMFPKNISFEDCFYVFGTKEMIKINTNKILTYPKNNLKISVSNIKYNVKGIEKKITNVNDSIVLPPKSMDIKIHFTINNLGIPFDFFEYQLNNEDWKKFNGQISLNTFNTIKGSQKIKIRDFENKKIYFTDSISVETITYEKIEFIILAYVVGLILLGIILFVYLNYLKTKFNEKNLKEKSKIKQSILAKVSHEIRTPLNAIIGFSELLSHSKTDKQLIQSYSSTINFASKNLLHLLNDFLTKSAIDENKLRLEIKPFNLDDTLNYLFNLFQNQVKDKKIDFIIKKESNINTHLIGDENKLLQIIINLVQNAIKFTDNGSITLAFKQTNIDMEKIQLHFSIIDTGIGISQENQKEVFDSYSQFHTNYKKHQGTGLGLMITKEIVLLCDGTISFESKQNKGTSFHVMLPLVIDHDSDIKKDEIIEDKFDNDTPSKSFKVLIAEDEKTNILLINTHLKSRYKNIEITNCEDGVEAIEAIKTNIFDVLILDVNMPHIDGIEVAKYYISIYQNNDNVICCTASGDFDESENLNNIFQHKLFKPYVKKNLYELIDNILLQASKPR